MKTEFCSAWLSLARGQSPETATPAQMVFSGRDCTALADMGYMRIGIAEITVTLYTDDAIETARQAAIEAQISKIERMAAAQVASLRGEE